MPRVLIMQYKGDDLVFNNLLEAPMGCYFNEANRTTYLCPNA